jgi:hypothetical protein
MLQTLSSVLGVVSLLCYFYVLYQMFTNAETVMGVICLVGLCLLGLGALVAFIYGWVKAWEWEIVPVMAVWSGCIAVQLIVVVIQILTQGAVG